ncbi:MAG: hypothetical protein QM751_01300 [Paludibacteraceae bacterium]
MKIRLLIRALLVSILLGIIFYNGFYGERITVGDGAGWDGGLYAKLCENFNTDFKGKNIDRYLFQRTLPFAVIHNVIEVFHLPKNIQTYNFLMSVINLLFVLVSAFVFFLISNFHKFNVKIEVIAFSSLFLNYPILKLMGYYPLLTDYLAFSFGLFSYYFYIKTQDTRHKNILILLSVFYVFIHPTALLQGLTLALLQRDSLLKTEKTDKNKVKRGLELFVFTVPLFIYFAIGFSHIFLHKFGVNLRRDVTNVELIFVSFICTLVYIYFFSKETLYKLEFADFLNKKGITNILKILIIYAGVSFLIFFFANTHSRHSMDRLLFEIATESLQAPFSNIVNMFAYYGLVIILLLIYWRKVAEIILNNGMGYLLVICMAFIFSIGNESRYLINFLPFLFMPVFILLNQEKKWSYSSSFVYLLLSLLLSRFWFAINKNGSFDWDNYMLSQGPWQPFVFYLMFLALFAGFYALFFIYTRKTKKNEN